MQRDLDKSEKLVSGSLVRFRGKMLVQGKPWYQHRLGGLGAALPRRTGGAGG